MLMRQMLIQKNGSIYVFLTDEEQEINNEIEKEKCGDAGGHHEDCGDDL